MIVSLYTQKRVEKEKRNTNKVDILVAWGHVIEY